MEFDVLIIGAGPAGLSTAIHLAQCAKQNNLSLEIAILEKGSQVGAHLLSGAVMDPVGLNALIPHWQERNAPVTVKVTQDYFYYLNKKKCYRLPTPSLMKNEGNYIISLGELCRWLAEQAESLGIQLFPGFAASTLLFNDDKSAILGVQTDDRGLDRQGQPTVRYQPGLDLFAKQTIFAEGCRGSLSQQLMQHFNLREKCDPQSYAIGVKELWKIPKEKHHMGTVIHTVGWPLDSKTYGGSFIYHFKDQLISLGLVIGLDYRNPYLDPFQELQQLKRHPMMNALLQGGECISYGARALNEGGWQAIPKLVFPGGLLVGCAAGMVNVGKIKGIHNAIRSGMLAAEAILQNLTQWQQKELTAYQTAFNQSPIYRELYTVRNLRPGFHYGLWSGLCYAALDYFIFRGHTPWTLHFKPDHIYLQPKSRYQPMHYPKPDNKITFDKLSQVFLTATNHRENEPCHLVLKDPRLATKINFTIYGGPEVYYCPAGVYEFISDHNEVRLQINATNCIHCKTCDIKDPRQNIIWKTPEGGEGPNYQQM
ncbi:MAG: electron transfer flavoprotein-ubiquinone oxidoreductase [Gammaproteobacteria bacterium RIFCSPHIGHO2_12_FULL_41_15]|nr:MAG: electron transfer flavoprotein-ubiquinone oxidoreductase [Gammaproteobacteria bacterium RIFCSPHIGHO2_12_FULL_41_15]